MERLAREVLQKAQVHLEIDPTRIFHNMLYAKHRKDFPFDFPLGDMELGIHALNGDLVGNGTSSVKFF